MAKIKRSTEVKKYKVGDYFYKIKGGKCHLVAFSFDGSIELIIFKQFLKGRGWTYSVEESEYLYMLMAFDKNN